MTKVGSNSINLLKGKNMKFKILAALIAATMTTLAFGTEQSATDHKAHEKHKHTHKKKCGHKEVKHDDHVDYKHGNHKHKKHGDHYDECADETTEKKTQ